MGIKRKIYWIKGKAAWNFIMGYLWYLRWFQKLGTTRKESGTRDSCMKWWGAGDGVLGLTHHWRQNILGSMVKNTWCGKGSLEDSTMKGSKEWGPQFLRLTLRLCLVVHVLCFISTNLHIETFKQCWEEQSIKSTPPLKLTHLLEVFLLKK